MSMDPMMVNYANCHTVLDELAQADTRMQGLISDLVSEIKPLQASWLGVSQDEYNFVQQKWNQHMTAMQGLVGQFAQVLGEMVINYNITDLTAASHWQAIP